MSKDEKDPFQQIFDNLESLADTISEVLNCPVTIEDANHRLLAYSSHEPGIDPARMATIVGRRVPEKVLNGLWQAGVIPRLLKSEEPIRISPIDDVGLGNRIAISIRNQDEVLGYIWLLEVDQHLDEAAFEQLKKAAKAAKTKLLQFKAHKQKEEQGHQEFFWQLLTGYLKSTKSIKEKAGKLPIQLPSQFQVLVFQFHQKIDEALNKQIQYIMTTLQRIRIVSYVMDREQLILLLAASSGQSYRELLQEFIIVFTTQMRERFKVTPIEAACGSIYQEDYAKVESSYQEALLVLKLKKNYPQELKNVYHFDHVGFYLYLPWIEERRKGENRINPHLLALKEYDQANGTSLYQTLEVFLGLDCNAKETAETLHVHINTLNYRIKRIEEISQIDIKNMDQKVSLYLDIKADKYEE